MKLMKMLLQQLKQHWHITSNAKKKCNKNLRLILYQRLISQIELIELEDSEQEEVLLQVNTQELNTRKNLKYPNNNHHLLQAI